MKVCSRCNKEKPLDDFAFRNKERNIRRAECRICRSELDANRFKTDVQRRANLLNTKKNMTLRAREWIWQYKSTHPCVDCGESDPIVLEFDHVRDIKLINISEMPDKQMGIKRIASEVSKCDVRCANCHRRVTFQRRLSGVIGNVSE